MVDDVAGGPGWTLRGSDLQPVITDLQEFRNEHSQDPLRHAVEFLWTGQPDRALHALDQEPAAIRVRALRAECRRYLGHYADAIASLHQLVTETIGTRHEAFMRQHLGKSLLAAGRREDAIEQFQIAVELRREAEPSLLASSQQALQYAYEMRVAGRSDSAGPPM